MQSDIEIYVDIYKRLKWLHMYWKSRHDQIDFEFTAKTNITSRLIIGRFDFGEQIKFIHGIVIGFLLSFFFMIVIGF